jgi:hypothetical protein
MTPSELALLVARLCGLLLKAKSLLSERASPHAAPPSSVPLTPGKSLTLADAIVSRLAGQRMAC